MNKSEEAPSTCIIVVRFDVFKFHSKPCIHSQNSRFHQTFPSLKQNHEHTLSRLMFTSTRGWLHTLLLQPIYVNQLQADTANDLKHIHSSHIHIIMPCDCHGRSTCTPGVGQNYLLHDSNICHTVK